MDKLLGMLGVEKLDESTQKDIKEKLETIVESKAREKADEIVEGELEESKDKLVEKYEEKFEDYKKDITSKFSNFVDKVLEDEMQLPDQIVEFARKGELYDDLIEQFKIRLGIDEDAIDAEVKNTLREAKEEILTLKEKLDESLSEKLDMERDAQLLSSELYVRMKSDGLTEAQKNHVLEILEGITDREEIDRKFDTIVESSRLLGEEDEEDDDDDDDDEDEKKDKKDMKEGKGQVEVEDTETEKVNEDSSPFASYINNYVKTLKENKI